MTTFAKNSDNDIYVSAGGLAMASGPECRRVIVDSIVRTQRGELQFDKARGIDYFGTVFTNPRYIAVWAGQVRSELSRLSWVRNIEEFTYSFNRSTGTVMWSVKIESAYGDALTANNETFSTGKGDGKMGIRWEDIIDRPAGLENVGEFIRAMRNAARHTENLEDASTLKDTKTVVNKIRDGIVQS